jgi:hypothetical protein
MRARFESRKQNNGLEFYERNGCTDVVPGSGELPDNGERIRVIAPDRQFLCWFFFADCGIK